MTGDVLSATRALDVWAECVVASRRDGQYRARFIEGNMPLYRATLPRSRNAYITREVDTLIHSAATSVPDTAILYESDLIQPYLLVIPEQARSLLALYGTDIHGDLIAARSDDQRGQPTDAELDVTWARGWSFTLFPDKRGVLITEWTGGALVPWTIAPAANVTWIFGKPLATAEDSETRPTGIRMLRYAYAVLRFMQQRITSRRMLPPPDRSTARRLVRAGIEHAPAVEVIELRRSASPHAVNQHGGPVDWACRWGVDGHWRNQPYPSTGEHKLIWIDPYLKGPPDRPLKIKPTIVYGLVR